MVRGLAVMAMLFAAQAMVPAAPRLKDTGDDKLYFPTAVGTRWVYDTGGGQYEEEITESKREGRATIVTVIRTECGDESWRTVYRVSGDGLEVTASGGVTYEKPLPLIRARRKPGEDWNYTYSRGEGLFSRNHSVCVGNESVEVRAGKFLALRLDSTDSLSIDGNAPYKGLPTSKWFAVGVGLVKSENRDGSVTLKSITPAK